MAILVDRFFVSVVFVVVVAIVAAATDGVVVGIEAAVAVVVPLFEVVTPWHTCSAVRVVHAIAPAVRAAHAIAPAVAPIVAVAKRDRTMALQE